MPPVYARRRRRIRIGVDADVDAVDARSRRRVTVTTTFGNVAGAALNDVNMVRSASRRRGVAIGASIGLDFSVKKVTRVVGYLLSLFVLQRVVARGCDDADDG
jgi:hypothetical protein